MKRLEKIKHFKIKCPVCGNTDFILLKEEPTSIFAEQSYAVGCTKCYLTLHFNPSPVYVSMQIEEERKKQTKQIEDLNEAVVELELELKQAIERIESFKIKKNDFVDADKYWEMLEDLKKEMEDINYRITLHKQELKKIQDEINNQEDWPEHFNIL